MKTSIFVPKKIYVGFQERSNTYTGKLVYIIYEDEIGGEDMVKKDLIQVKVCANEETSELWLEFTKTNLCDKLNMDGEKLRSLCDNFAKELDLLMR